MSQNAFVHGMYSRDALAEERRFKEMLEACCDRVDAYLRGER